MVITSILTGETHSISVMAFLLSDTVLAIEDSHFPTTTTIRSIMIHSHMIHSTMATGGTMEEVIMEGLLSSIPSIPHFTAADIILIIPLTKRITPFLMAEEREPAIFPQSGQAELLHQQVLPGGIIPTHRQVQVLL